MNGWTEHKGTAACLPLNNVDTDQLIPARFMSRPRSEGYGDYLLHDVRQDSNGKPDPRFVLNKHPSASVLVAGQNFGSGSSREAAVYALIDAGIRAVVAPSFADIFAANAINNGLLPACIDESDYVSLSKLIGENTIAMQISLKFSKIGLYQIDTETTGSGLNDIQFSINVNAKERLINGWDDIDLTQQYHTQIAAFKEQRYENNGWALPRTNLPSANLPNSNKTDI